MTLCRAQTTAVVGTRLKVRRDRQEVRALRSCVLSVFVGNSRRDSVQSSCWSRCRAAASLPPPSQQSTTDNDDTIHSLTRTLHAGHAHVTPSHSNSGSNWLRLGQDICIASAFLWAYSPLKRSELHVLMRDHTVLSATHSLIHEWNEPFCFYSPAAEHRHTLAGTHFLFHRVGGWVGLGGWLHTEMLCPLEDDHPSHYQCGDRGSNSRLFKLQVWHLNH